MREIHMHVLGNVGSVRTKEGIVDSKPGATGEVDFHSGNLVLF